ncbi:MAG: 3-deoxy-manno-octulosonate cytidylyltransferase [Gemmatimonadota bacterium]|nr:MAG: 3-deoxy-manno-octulosonate cytidylyltransferase [Gemmatimonadota bacterium]
MRVLTIIPARIGSSRLPEKPLRSIRGEPLIRIVARTAIDLPVSDEVVVATDDRRVVDAVRPLGVRGVLTSPDHESGTERLAEVLQMPEFADWQLILNLQGDQPYLPAVAAAGALQQVRSGCSVGTAAAALRAGDLTNRNVVKVVVDESGRASEFSRRQPAGSPVGPGHSRIFHHLGVYAYERETVLEWVRLPGCSAARTQGLEQLRPLRAGMSIGVALCNCVPPLAIDTEDDLRCAQLAHRNRGVQTRKSA